MPLTKNEDVLVEKAYDRDPMQDQNRNRTKIIKKEQSGMKEKKNCGCYGHVQSGFREFFRMQQAVLIFWILL